MGYKKAEKRIWSVGFSASNPLDATAYRFCSTNYPLTVAPLYQLVSTTKPIVITHINLTMASNIIYSNEDWGISLRDFTVGTNYSLGNMIKTPYGGGQYSNLDAYVNLPFAANSLFQFITTTPTWATNPSDIKCVGYIEYIES